MGDFRIVDLFTQDGAKGTPPDGEQQIHDNSNHHPTLLSSLSGKHGKSKGGYAEKPSCGQRHDRVRVECHVCGYKCVPQWLNDQARCLKCQSVLKTQANIHQKEHLPRMPPRSNFQSSSTPDL